MIVAGGETRGPDAARQDVLSYDPASNSWTTLEPMHTARHGIDLAVCGNAVYVVAGMGNFGAANVTGTVEVLTMDGSAPSCPLTAAPEVAARRGAPSEVEPAWLPALRRTAARSGATGIAARSGAAGAGLFCSV
jgi:hypothetical protein